MGRANSPGPFWGLTVRFLLVVVPIFLLLSVPALALLPGIDLFLPVVGVSLLAAVIAATIGFRVIIARPLNRLVSAIHTATETGTPTRLEHCRLGEFGLVKGTFDDMVARVTQREKDLAEANAALLDYQTKLKQLNQELEERIQARKAELRDREAERLWSEQRFRSFAEASSDWFWEMDENLRFSYFSGRFSDVTGVDQEMLLGKTREETGVPNVDHEAWRRHLDDLHAKRAFRGFVHPRTKEDGSVVWLSISGKPVFDDEGDFKGFLGTGSDITERVQMEKDLAQSRNALQERVDQLEAAKRELEEHSAALVRLASDLNVARDAAEDASRAKSIFLANMSHELRTPLNAIIGFSEIIKDEYFGPLRAPVYRDYAGDIHTSGQHLLGLINDLLDLCKIESGEDELCEEAIGVGSAVEAVLRLVGRRAEQGGVELLVELEAGLPGLHADRRKLIQILVNLLSNAVKFTESGGRVTLKAWRGEDGGLLFQVIDTGIGMAPEDIPKALSQFAQVDTELNRRYEGTGLGLPLAKGLIELHGGSLELQSEPGVGTTATVRFPAERTVTASGLEPSTEREERRAG